MRILFFDNNEVLEKLLPKGFASLGHEVEIFSHLTEQNVPQKIAEFNPDLIITQGWGSEQVKFKQKWIRDSARIYGVPQIYWSVEDPTYTKYFSLPLIRILQPDYVFTTCPSAVEYFRSLGFRAARLDFGFHPHVHYNVKPEKRYRCDIALIANSYAPPFYGRFNHAFRFKSYDILIRPLLYKNSEVKVNIWGSNWEGIEKFWGCGIPTAWMRGNIPYLENNKVYSSAKIVLGVQNKPEQMAQRTYEILGSSAFLLTIGSPEIRRLFRPGRDLVVSSSPRETLALVNYYLNNDRAREKIAKQGRKAVAKHHYKYRAQYIINVLRGEKILR